MRRNKAILLVDQYRERRKQFLKTQECDVYLLLESKMVGLHQQYLRDSQYFVKQVDEENRRLCLLDEHVNSFVLYKVLGCLYGLECCFERAWEAVSLYEVIVLLQITMLKKLMEKDFKNNFDQYGFFVLFSISIKFNIPWLLDMCKEQLLLFSFQQLNFNRSDFILCDIKTVEYLINFYCQFHKTPKIMPKQKFKNIVSLYCKEKEVQIQVNVYLQQYVENVIEEADIDAQTSSCSTMRKKKLPIEYKCIHFDREATASTPNRYPSERKKKLDLLKNKLVPSTILDELASKCSSQFEGQELGQIQQNMSDSSNEEDFRQVQTTKFTFTDLCGFTQSKFIQSQPHPIRQKKVGKQGRRKHRSSSPPASPWTPQFGEYLKKSIKSKKEGKKKRMIYPKKKYFQKHEQSDYFD